MIKSIEQYYEYLEADRLALNYPKYSVVVRLILFLKRNPIIRFQRLLRKCEYYKNVKCENNRMNNLVYLIYKFRYKNLSLKLGFSIPENVFGPGLAILHYGTIVVNHRAKVGANCRLHACTNIGESGGVAGAPIIGDNVYIGPGAKIYGKITIASNIAIAANAAVNRSCLESNSSYGGVPAKRLGDIDISRLIPQLRKA